MEELHHLFNEEIIYEWVEAYKNDTPAFGTITIQNFRGFCFAIDDGNQLAAAKQLEGEILESRVVGAFGISKQAADSKNRSVMRRWIGQSSQIFSAYGGSYDKGHFIAHASGGPIDVNLFPQRSDINRGIGTLGKKYRAMERFVAANSGVLVFSRPIYKDLSFCPNELEFGYCDCNLKFHVHRFPNRYLAI
jgi:hypothetical protein